MPREAGMMKISSSQLAMQHLSPCNSSVKKAAEGGGGVQEGIVFIWQRLKAITASLLFSSWIWILFQGWSFLCAFVATNPADSASDWSHMKTYFVTYYGQFYKDLSEQALVSLQLKLENIR